MALLLHFWRSIRSVSRRDIAKLLRAKGIPFIVVGMGIHHGNPGLTGMVDSTLIDDKSAPNVFEEIAGEQLVDLLDEYQKNIQTVELNALNAAMAVFMYKKYRGYYASAGLFIKHRLLRLPCS